LSVTLASRELSIPNRPTANDHPAVKPHDFLARLERWRLRPDLVTAAELVEAAIVEGRESDAIAAARRLLTVDETAAPLIRQQAAALLMRAGASDDIPDGPLLRASHGLGPRYYTRVHPRDPLAWVDLSLHQTISGQPEAAVRSMSVALALAPHNRHVLRSAARLFLHRNEPEKAHELILRNDATGHDPWLMSAEIALAEVAERRPRFLKSAQRFLERANVPARQISELAGALGTEELLNGNRRKARRDFASSLLDPTGNSLAQGEWAALDLGPALVPVARLKSAPEPSEALAFHLQRLGHFKYVPKVCIAWAAEDPFSIRPYEFGTATASFIERYNEAAVLALKGLELRPNAPSLLNGAAFSLACSGRLDDAKRYLDRIGYLSDAWWEYFTAANRGLIAFRSGDEDQALTRYREAIDGFARAGNAEMSARARVYLAREAILAGSEKSEQLLKEAQTAIAQHKGSRETIMTLRRAEETLLKKKSPVPDEVQRAQA
jgi:tetratricopeptide (TPR) repeat protein